MLGLVLFAFLSFAGLALAPMGIAADVRPGAIAFLHGIRWGVPALSLYLAMRYLSDGLHWTLPTMVLGFGGLLVLVPLRYVLTFGAFGFPDMGAGGLGVASPVLLSFSALALAIYLSPSTRFAPPGLFPPSAPPSPAPLTR